MRSLFWFALLAPALIGCGSGRFDNTPKPEVTLSEADLGLPVYPGATQIFGQRTETKVDANFETKDAFDAVYQFYSTRLAGKMALDKTDKGGVMRVANGNARKFDQIYEVKLEFKPETSYTQIRLTRTKTEPQKE